MTEYKLLVDGKELKVSTHRDEDRNTFEVTFAPGVPCTLHWGLRGVGREWKSPPENIWPAQTTSADAQSADSLFPASPAESKVSFSVPNTANAKGVMFVLHFPQTKRWVKNGNEDYYIPFEGNPQATPIDGMIDTICGAEVGKGSWTLMHRFHLAHDLINEANNNPDALALIFVWLRFSAIRQLDWQRNYNTKPRELSAAQDRLTKRIAALYRHSPAARTWARGMLTTLGRGGEGQQVRDEILQIMHRHHIKETHGHFMEEWHQKLHNNTTPDDVIICEALLAFLDSNGDLKRFYDHLEGNGVTRDRLRSFERAIKTDPNFNHGDKERLMPEFRNFLRILKSVHSGTDFDSAVDAAQRYFSGELRGKIQELGGMRHGHAPLADVAKTATAAREILARDAWNSKDDGAMRDLLYLDLALEGFLRLAFERQDWLKVNRDTLSFLLQLVVRNLQVTNPSDELGMIQRHFDALVSNPNKDANWALQAKSVTDRLGRCVQEISSSFYATLQPKAEQLGRACKVQDWVLPLFSEEVIRGSLLFVLSLMLRRLDAELRAAAGLGGWQVVSPSNVKGRVRVVDSLMSVQGQRFGESTVIVSDHVSGNEDIPEGVAAVITTATVDLVSHAAVRARNGRVLFATCFDAKPYETLKALNGKNAALEVSPGGDVLVQESSAGSAILQEHAKLGGSIRQRAFSTWAVSAGEFTPEIVGGKSNNLNGLRGKLPDWIAFPKSMALPFGVFEKLLSSGENSDVREKYAALVGRIEENVPATLQKIRALILELKPAADFDSALVRTWERTGLPPFEREANWKAITRVWASKWNDRAYLSRRALGLSHTDLTMAVLIQEVVEADYAFVIHTANPINGNRGEIFGEVVLGLGETLVGNDPGRAFGFVFRKNDGAVKLISYPGKSSGLYGKGLIFRSDSNGEDLEGFAGAGLYDSVLAHEPERRRLDYSREPLVTNAKFRADLVAKIAHVGLEVEKAFSAPQDIEGAISRGQSFVVQTRPQVGL